jgi:Omp85 superfamily domain
MQSRDMKCKMLKHHFSILFLLFLFIIPFRQDIYSQSNSNWFSGYRSISAGDEYEAGWLHEAFFGSHWRDVWTTPVKFGIINLNTYGGGLTPLEKGGGLQTKSLKFKDTDGVEYKFRSLRKDPRKTLPADLQETIAKDIIQDQISSSNPYAGFVVNEILKAAGIKHSDYTLVILPDDEKLGKFRSEFAGLFGLMEIVPGEELFEGSDKVIGTVKLLDRLNKEDDEFVDSKEFLKARLIDIFLGDWDRHKDQWKWIRYEEGGRKVYKPFPMDRDQAFAKFDGLLPFIAEQNLPQLNNFGFDYPKMRFISWSGRYIDQRFLTFLTKKEWDEVTDEVVSVISDEVITGAVKKLPPEVFPIANKEITSKLKSRRNKLKEASKEYYELVNSVIDIYASDKDDLLEIVPAGKERFEVKLSRKSKDGSTKVMHSKVFDCTRTCEMRVYLQDGDDNVKIAEGTRLPKLRFIGGDGKDEILNSSDENVCFYDDGKKTRTSGDVYLDDSRFKLPYEKPLAELKDKKDIFSKKEKDVIEETIGNLRYDPVVPPDKFFNTSFYPIFYYTPDIGPLLGGGFTYSKYGFRMNPYLYRMSLRAAYAPKKNGITGLAADIRFDFLGVIKNASLQTGLRKSGIEINNYFGQGNNTVYDESLNNNGHYEVQFEELSYNTSVTYPLRKKYSFTIGALVKSSKVKQFSEAVDTTGDIYSPNDLSTLRAELEFELDGRDHTAAPYTGYYANVGGSYTPEVFNNQSSFGKVYGDLRGYIGYKTNISLALRFRAEKVFGIYPFFESAFLGGTGSLRGYPSERFAGNTSVLGSAELRLKLFKMNVLLGETLGIFGFGETGRVFVENDNSRQWHPAFGGGLFMHMVGREVTLKLTFASSKETKTLIYFTTGFGF